MVTFTIPWTKMTREEGAILTLVGSDECSPADAMRLHLCINKDAPASSHLFSYQDIDGDWVPMTKAAFMERCNSVWTDCGMLAVDGHSFRIGGSTELLLGGVPPHVVAMAGRWKSLTFLKYWRNVSEIIVNSFASSYDISRIPAVTTVMDSLYDPSRSSFT